MKIAIIGAGWYGCHIALSLLQSGHTIKIYEKSTNTISGASKRNQNRLHLGFHYPRNHNTRTQSKEGFNWFIEHYEHLTSEIENNIYAISDEGSYIDGDTFKIIMEGSGLSFEATKPSYYDKFNGLNSFITCNERVIKNNLATAYFDNILGNYVEFGRYVDLNNNDVVDALKSNYDYIIDCTWGVGKKIEGLDYYYEPCIYFYYRNKSDFSFALTIMDGPFYSLYPYYEDIYTLTSVKNTPLGQFDNINEAISCLAKSKKDRCLVNNKREIFEREFKAFFPSFLEDFEYVGVEFSLKTKIRNSTDFRGCIIKHDEENKMIHVFSGKIDTLHIAEEEIIRIIKDA